MKFGMNLLLWSGQLDDRLWPTVELLKQMGYDGVELPMFEPDEARCAGWAARLDDLGLERTAVAIRGADDNPISPNPAVRARAVACTKRALDGCQAAGCSQLVGPIHSGSANSLAPVRRPMSGAGAWKPYKRWPNTLIGWGLPWALSV